MSFELYEETRIPQFSTFSRLIDEPRLTEQDILILLGIVSPAVITHGLFGTTMNGLLFDSLPFKLASAKPYSWMNPVRVCTNPAFLTITLAGIVWILFIQERSVTSVDLTNSRDPENGI